MPSHWALDLGTTNSVAAQARGGSVTLVQLPGLSRVQPSDQAYLIPSALSVFETTQPWLYFFRRRHRQVFAGQRALDQNLDGQQPNFAEDFKRYLGSQPHRPTLRLDSGDLSVREVVRLFVKEVVTALEAYSGESIKDLAIPAPVGFYDPYRAHLHSLAREVGIHRFRSLDEPVAAALGYGVNIAREETLLVVDFGGGTLDLAVARLGPETAESGAAPILAKHMVHLGGSDVDQWLIELLVPAPIRDLPAWRHDLRWEAMRLKERVSREGSGEFCWGGLRRPLDREDLTTLLTERGLYAQLGQALEDVRQQMLGAGLGGRVDEVLLVGGSTLLPGVAAAVDNAFPDAVVRHDPVFLFTGVALGAARFASGAPVDDFIYHDYALAVQNEQTHSVEYELITPRRTRYPTVPDFAVRYYADYVGMAEVRFTVCEVGRLGQAPVAWEERPNGGLYWAPQCPKEKGLVMELNAADEPVGLRPPGRGASPRLRVAFSVNSDRWLCATVEDLVRKEVLREQEPVVRLR
ncbi:MAG TPA: Hsp70 family protein [Armatimonadota bacterium]